MADMDRENGSGRIVVGVDGSEASKGALLWAAHEAELRAASLEVVMVREMPFRSYGRLIRVPELDYEVDAEHRLHETVHEVLGGSKGSESWARPTKLKITVLEGRPVPALFDAARGADMLVVGSSRHGPLVGGLLGSVSEQCVGHVTCPVVVVRHETTS